MISEFPRRNALGVEPVHFLNCHAIGVWDEKETETHHDYCGADEDEACFGAEIARVNVVHVWHCECEEPAPECVGYDADGLGLGAEVVG